MSLPTRAPMRSAPPATRWATGLSGFPRLFAGVTLTTLVVLMLHLRRETLSAADRASGRAAFLDVSSLNLGRALTGVPPVFFAGALAAHPGPAVIARFLRF